MGGTKVSPFFCVLLSAQTQPGPALKFTGDIPVIIQLVICSQKLAIALQYITPVNMSIVARCCRLKKIFKNKFGL
jgi:hypothetical protein